MRPGNSRKPRAVRADRQASPLGAFLPERALRRGVGGLLVGLAVATASCRARSPEPPAEPACRILATAWDDQALAELARGASGTVLVAGGDVLDCPCRRPVRRTVAGADEARSVHGADDARPVRASDPRPARASDPRREVRHAGESRRALAADERREAHGADERRPVRAGDTRRAPQGTDEARAVVSSEEGPSGYSVEERAMPVCSVIPGCSGFRVTGADVTHRYHRGRLVSADALCVTLD